MTSGRLACISENIFKLREQDRIIGCYLYDELDEALSRVEALMVEPGTYLPRYLLITLGGTINIQGKKVLLRQGVSLDGRLGVLYSQDGLNDTSHTQGCCCCGGNELTNSEKITVNVLAYALLF